MSKQKVISKTCPNKIKALSLFTGAMGLDIGLEQQGFQIIVCNETDDACVSTIKANRPKIPIIQEPIEHLNIKHFESAAGCSLNNISLVAGGPPCQSFSIFGNRRGVEESRGRLIYEFLHIVSQIRPKTFIMENVRGLHSMPLVPKKALLEYPDILSEKTEKGSLLRDIISKFENIGYRLDCFLVNVLNYGGPQLRERLICIGNKFNLSIEFPQPKFSNRPQDKLPSFRTLRDAISNKFKDPDPSIMNFSPRKLKYLSMVPPGGNWRSLPTDIQKESMGKSWYLKGGRSAYWRKLSFDFPCPTVVTMPNHAGTSMCHPTELRVLTVGECAAVQEFPPDWVFKGTTAEKYRQIGNAVPIRLGYTAGGVIKDLLQKIKKISTARKTHGEPIPSTIKHIRPHVRTRSFYRNGKALAGSYCYYNGNLESEDQPLFKV